MPRQPRFWFPGAVLHVIQRGNNRGAIFVNDRDRLRYIDDLGGATREHGVRVHSYVLMTNHVHLLVSPARPDSLPCAMQTTGRRYVCWFNRMHERTGTLWEGRYKASLVEADAYLLACMRYIELNPIRAALAAAPAAYRWSSHCANAYGRPDPLVVPHPTYSALGSARADACGAYRRMFEDALGEHFVRAIRDATQFEWALGGDAFCRLAEAAGGRRTTRLPPGPRPRLRNEENRL